MIPREAIPLPFIKGSVIYFLCKGNAVVYVGKTTNFFSRISEHINSTKDFDDVFYVLCPIESLNETETIYIKNLRPKYNKHHNKTTAKRKSKIDLAFLQAMCSDGAIASVSRKTGVIYDHLRRIVKEEIKGSPEDWNKIFLYYLS